MKPNLIFRSLLSLVFILTILFTVSVGDVHYLFAHHEIHEHCENHIHSKTNHEDCLICKFDISLYTHHVYSLSIVGVTYFSSSTILPVISFQFVNAGQVIALRGPPTLA